MDELNKYIISIKNIVIIINNFGQAILVKIILSRFASVAGTVTDFLL